MRISTSAFLFLIGVLMCAACPQTVSAARAAEGAVGPLSVPPHKENMPIDLKSVQIEKTDDETVHDYLTAIEEEILFLEKKNLLSSGAAYGVLSFSDCLQIATERHLPIEIAEDKISLYQRKLVSALRELFPSVNFFYEHNKGFKLLKADTNPGDRSNQNFRSEKWRLALQQPVFRGGALWNKVNEERANLRSAKAEYDKVFLDLSIEVARAYFSYSKAKTMLEHKENAMATAKHLLSLSEEKMKAALISEIEHLNVQSQESQLQHDLEVVKEDIALALLDLQKVLHLDVDQAIEVLQLEGEYSAAITKEMEARDGEEERSEDEQEVILDVLVERAYADRPEFIIQKSKLDAAIYREKQAVGGWFPQATMGYEMGQKAEAYIEDDNNPPWDQEHRVTFDVRWNLAGSTARYMYDKNRQGVGVEATEPGLLGTDGYYDRKNMVSFSVLDGLDQFEKTKSAEISRKESQLELELSEKDIVSQVKEAYFNYNRALIQLKSTNKRLAYRRKLVDLAKHRSEINEIQISEYIQAEMDLVNENDTLYKAMVDFLLAKIALHKSIGIKEFSLRDGTIPTVLQNLEL
jgi:outer membrane protein TolC